MFTHNVRICCEQMQEWIQQGKIRAGTDGKAYAKLLFEPTPTGSNDVDLSMDRIEVKRCPNCGRAVVSYDVAVPAPTIERAVNVGGSCNDNSCRFFADGLCSFAFRSQGCFVVDANAQTIVATLEADSALTLQKKLVKVIV